MPTAPSIRHNPDSRAVMDAIRRIVHALQVGSRASQKLVGLSSAQLFVLQTLASGGVMSINELAARSHTHQSSVSVVVSRLAASKLIERSPASADARRSDVTVSAAGLRLLRSRIVTPQERLIESLEQLPLKRLKELHKLLDEVISMSGFELVAPSMFFEGSAEKRRKAKRVSSSVAAPASPRPIKKE